MRPYGGVPVGIGGGGGLELLELLDLSAEEQKEINGGRITGSFGDGFYGGKGLDFGSVDKSNTYNGAFKTGTIKSTVVDQDGEGVTSTFIKGNVVSTDPDSVLENATFTGPVGVGGSAGGTGGSDILVTNATVQGSAEVTMNSGSTITESNMTQGRLILTSGSTLDGKYGQSGGYLVMDGGNASTADATVTGGTITTGTSESGKTYTSGNYAQAAGKLIILDGITVSPSASGDFIRFEKAFDIMAGGWVNVGVVMGGQWLSGLDSKSSYSQNGEDKGDAFSLGAYGSWGNGLTDVWMDSDNFLTSAGHAVSYGSTTGLEGKVGVQVGYSGASRLSPYAEMAVIQGFGGKTDVHFAGTKLQSDPTGTRVRGSLGASYGISDSVSLYLDAAYEHGKKYRDLNGNVGINFSW